MKSFSLLSILDFLKFHICTGVNSFVITELFQDGNLCQLVLEIFLVLFLF